jgi:DNA-directed RNA polymerase specialized sigma24 family protein
LPDGFDASSDNASTLTDLERREFLADFNRCRAELTEREREAFDRRRHGETLQTIANNLKCCLAAVFNAERRARQKLAQCLGEHWRPDR